MKNKINKSVKFREPWRPFAPAVLEELCGDYFDSDHPSPNMLFVYRSRYLEVGFQPIPAVTHIDESARVQTVTEETNPRFYRLIGEFGNITGHPVVLNTSLNVKGEPIVCTPAEAIHCYLNSGMDCLVLGDYVLEKEDDGGKVGKGGAR
jgi:carbamoyltransferase